MCASPKKGGRNLPILAASALAGQLLHSRIDQAEGGMHFFPCGRSLSELFLSLSPSILHKRRRRAMMLKYRGRILLLLLPPGCPPMEFSLVQGTNSRAFFERVRLDRSFTLWRGSTISGGNI